MSTRHAGPDRTAELQPIAAKLRSGQHARAISDLHALLQAQPDDVAALRLLGISLARTGKAREAEPWLARAAQLQPGSASAASDHANVLLILNRFDQALITLRAHEQSLGQNMAPGDSAAFWFNLGRAYKQTGQTQQAVAPLLNTLKITPGHYGALIVLGDVYKALGEAGSAIDCYRRAIAVDPTDGTAWWCLSNLKSGRFTPEEIVQLQEKAGEARSLQQQLMFEFALAAASDQLGQIEQAFRHYAAGNRLARQREPWDRRQYRSWLHILQDKIQRVKLRQRPPSLTAFVGESGPRPIFIISLPRSGSTLVEQVLAAHSHVTAASELPWIPQIIAQESANKGSGLADWIDRQAPADWLRLGQQYLEKCEHWTRDTAVFTDKLPGNVPYIGAILAMLPQALVVGVRRDAMDVCWSCYRQLLMGGSEFLYDFQSLADYWTDFENHLDFWEQQAPGRVLSLQYEQLVADPETQTRRLLEFAGLEFEAACLNPQQAQRAVNTASALQVREPIHARGIGHWQRYAAYLGELQAALANQNP